MEIMKRLPMELRYYIIPYAYNIQNKELLMDIKTNLNDFSLVESFYFFDYNDHILLYDILLYLTNINKLNILNRYCVNVHINFKKTLNTQIIHQYNKPRLLKIIWGLLTRTERTEFINTFILEEDN